ncbi:hypothetical protein GGU10DRAFT_382201 [Lentinula aff. detonsa]|uniref:Uncharacterized protein n=1 Tax=Lentinula aff. detonsa TaxID=2804958 RepID=A0AA38KKK3_9AGAR|nr:hypothetical protein GGU10DRAFT_382201 [Lentinula aff. detonsa]
MTSFSIYPQPCRIGPPLKRSSILDNNGFNDWDDYSVEPVDTHHLNPRKRFPINALVDHHTICSSTPIDLGLEFRYRNPSTGEVNSLWSRDTELRWTEITAGTCSGIVPDRYVAEVGAHGQRYGPMTRDNFLRIVSDFHVSDSNVLYRGNLKVATVQDDFEWCVYAKLCSRVDDFDLANYDVVSLVDTVQQIFGTWHLDANLRASTILQHYHCGA